MAKADVGSGFRPREHQSNIVPYDGTAGSPLIQRYDGAESRPTSGPASHPGEHLSGMAFCGRDRAAGHRAYGRSFLYQPHAAPLPERRSGPHVNVGASATLGSARVASHSVVQVHKPGTAETQSARRTAAEKSVDATGAPTRFVVLFQLSLRVTFKNGNFSLHGLCVLCVSAVPCC